jgi:hypothetical protein
MGGCHILRQPTETNLSWIFREEVINHSREFGGEGGVWRDQRDEIRLRDSRNEFGVAKAFVITAIVVESSSEFEQIK